MEEEEEDDEEEDDEEEEEEEEEEEDEVSIVLGLKAVLYSLKHKKITIARARAGQSIQSPTMEWRGYERLQESMRLACDVLSLAPELAACLSFFALSTLITGAQPKGVCTLASILIILKSSSFTLSPRAQRYI